MKIGILTHHYIANFGAFLQAYALQTAIQSLFPNDNVKIIDYYHTKHFIINNGGWFRFYAKREKLSSWLSKIHLPFTFSKARKRYLNLTHAHTNAAGVNKEKLDTIVIGSDEVWNFKDSKGHASIKFGLGLDCPNLVSYAPSVGNSSKDDVLPNYVVKGLKRFKSISVRDSLGQDLVEFVTGSRPVKVLDPTFLIDFPHEDVKLTNDNYILFYYCEHLPEQIKKQIIEYAHSKGLAIYGAGECDKAYTDTTVNLTPFQWVTMFRNARFVFTGTFHGVAFSIQNHRQFKVYVTQPNRIRKVSDLLAQFGISNRDIKEDFIFDLEKQSSEIDYGAVQSVIDEKKSISIDYLRNAIRV